MSQKRNSSAFYQNKDGGYQSKMADINYKLTYNKQLIPIFGGKGQIIVTLIQVFNKDKKEP